VSSESGFAADGFFRAPHNGTNCESTGFLW
jgi:hypothetical protein